MFALSFNPFLALLLLGLISGFVIHVIAAYRLRSGFDGFLYAWIGGYIGAWFGTPVFGHWGMHVANIFIIPALLGAFVGSFLVVAVMKECATALSQVQQRDNFTTQSGGTARLEMKKAS